MDETKTVEIDPEAFDKDCITERLPLIELYEEGELPLEQTGNREEAA